LTDGTTADEHGNEKKVPSARNGKGKRWMARYVDDEGSERSKAFDRKGDAQVWLDSEVTAKLATGTYVAPRAGLITVEEIYASWSATQGHLSASTIKSRCGAWRNHVVGRWGQTSVVDVKTSAVKAWVTQMITDEVGVPTIIHAFGVLRQVLDAAAVDHRVPRNPCDGVELPKSKHADRGYLSHAQVADLAAAMEYLPEVIWFLAYTGLRWGEMAALRVWRLRHAAKAGECLAIVHRDRDHPVRHAQDRRAALGALPGVIGRRAVRADGRQGPRGSGVYHPPAQRSTPWLELPAPVLRPGCGEVPEDRQDVPVDHSA